MFCWQCGEQLTDVILPMSRREECSHCGADQHVCKMFQEYDGNRSCNEPRAETVSDLEKANFCDYFSPSGQQFARKQTLKSQQAKAKLAALFGDEPEVEEQGDQNQQSTNQLADSELTPAQIAEKKLREMLGG